VLRGGRIEVILPILSALLVSSPLLFDPWALVGPDTFRTFDWLETAKLDAYSRLALLHHSTLPFWNPLLQGGFPQLAHPSDGSLSPLLLPTLLLGEAAGMKINVMMALALGALGTALLGRDRMGLQPRLAAFAGCAFAVAGWVPSRVAVGYYESALYAFFPLVLWLFLQSERRPWRLLGATVLLALLAMHVHLGMLVLIPMLLLITLFEICRGALRPAYLGRLALLGAGAVAMSAVKLLPLAAQLQARGLRSPNTYRSFDAFYASPAELWTKLARVVPEVGRYDQHGSMLSGDFGFVGLGIPLLLLAAGGVVFSWAAHRGQIAFAGLFVLLIWLCFGFNAPLDLFRVLWSVPLFDTLRGALRYYTFGLAWCGCLLAAGMLQLLVLRSRAWPLAHRLLLVIALVSLACPAAQSALRFHSSFSHPAAPRTPRPEKYFQEQLAGDQATRHLGGDPGYDQGNLMIYRNLKAGIGTVYVPEDLPVKSQVQGRRVFEMRRQAYRQNPGYRGEAACARHGCSARITHVGPNYLYVKASLDKPDVLLVNQNPDPRWTLTSNRPEILGPPEAINGLLGVRIKGTGPVEVVFEYQPPPEFWTGLLISFCGLFGGLGWAVVRHVRRRRL